MNGYVYVYRTVYIWVFVPIYTCYFTSSCVECYFRSFGILLAMWLEAGALVGVNASWI